MDGQSNTEANERFFPFATPEEERSPQSSTQAVKNLESFGRAVFGVSVLLSLSGLIFLYMSIACFVGGSLLLIVCGILLLRRLRTLKFSDGIRKSLFPVAGWGTIVMVIILALFLRGTWGESPWLFLTLINSFFYVVFPLDTFLIFYGTTALYGEDMPEFQAFPKTGLLFPAAGIMISFAALYPERICPFLFCPVMLLSNIPFLFFIPFGLYYRNIAEKLREQESDSSLKNKNF